MNWSIGPMVHLWGAEGWPQHRAIAKSVQRARKMGHTGMIIYGEMADRNSGFTARVPRNEISYLALAEFAQDPELTIEEFECRHREMLRPRTGWPAFEAFV